MAAVSINLVWTKVVDAAQADFLIKWGTADVPVRVAVMGTAATPDAYAGSLYSNDDVVTRASIGAGHVWVRLMSSVMGGSIQVQVENSSGVETALQALAAGSGSLASAMLVAKTNQQVTRNSVNTAADNAFSSLYSFILPGGSMGPNGTLRWEAEVSFTDPATGASTNGFQLRIGAVGICPEYNNATGGQLNDNRGLEWHNTSVAAQKYRGSFVKQTGSATAFTTTAIDTSVDQTVSFDCRWSAATSAEVLRLESLRVWVEYGA